MRRQNVRGVSDSVSNAGGGYLGRSGNRGGRRHWFRTIQYYLLSPVSLCSAKTN